MFVLWHGTADVRTPQRFSPESEGQQTFGGRDREDRP